MQLSEPQHPAPLTQAPPSFRQQFSAPSEAMPLSAQTTVPPAWLHSLDAVQVAPGTRLPLDVPPQIPLVQSALPQQWK